MPQPPPAAAGAFNRASLPVDDSIYAVRQRPPDRIRTKPAPPSPIVIPPTPSDDGFTRIRRASPLHRDALGIPIGKKFTRSKSKSVRYDDDDDTTPLSPDTEAQTAPKQRPKRKTLWGVIEGWWDLGLLERGKSLRRKPYNGL
ncbi:hypothetical protein GGR52DRAFT_491604 [Hypoxylon sp. FL1284]|nr:hypothetical protein GGR52DRAFT_491604 [Hypoxylon sp. FL1284]